MCERIIDLGREGAGQCEMAADLDIHYSTFLAWQTEKPEFSDAVKQAVRLSQAWWEREGRKGTFGEYKGFNATSYIFQMKNRFSDDWRDKQDVEHSGAIETTTKEQRDAAVAAASRADG